MSPKKNIIFIASMLFVSALIVLFLEGKFRVAKKTEAPVPVELPENNNIEKEGKKTENIIVDNIVSGQKISSPLEITGQARNWYFEAQFPVKLEDEEGKVIAQTAAMAQGDWMTDDYVPFKATLQFDVPSGIDGTLVFQKDNPSGLPEKDEFYEIPVKIVPLGR